MKIMKLQFTMPALAGILFLTASQRAQGDPAWNFASCPDYHQAERELTPPIPQDNLERINAFMGDVAAHGAEFLMVAGDFLDGRWTAPAFVKQYGHGDANAAIRNAGVIAYGGFLNRLASQGIPRLIPAVGDHELGDNNWKTKVKKNALPAYRSVFSDMLLKDKQGRWLWNEPVGKCPARPAGTLYEATSNAYRRKNVLIVTLDVFETSQTTLLDARTGYVRVSLDSSQLAWLDELLGQARLDPSIKHIIVQGHCAVLWPMRKYRSSGLYFQPEAGKRFWDVLKKYQVDMYIAGEVHASTVTIGDGDVTQWVHGGGVTGWHSTWSIITVEDNRIVVTGRGYDETSGTLVDRGQLIIDKSGPQKRISGTGILAPLQSGVPIIEYTFDAPEASTSMFHNSGSFGDLYYGGERENVAACDGVAGGKGARFSGPAYVRSVAFVPNSNGEPMTVAAWIKTTGSGLCGIFGVENYQEAKRKKLGTALNFALDNGTLKLLDREGRVYASCADGGKLNDGQWHHVAFVATGSTAASVRFHIDGKACKSATGNAKEKLDYNEGRCMVGRIGIQGAGHSLDGEMDNFMFWPRALSADEISSLFAGFGGIK